MDTVQTLSMKSCGMYMENNSAILKEPDVVLRQPITTQAALSLVNCSGPWSYTPVPMGRQNYHVISIISQTKSGPISESKDSISISTHVVSRDWSKDLFESFKDVCSSKNKCSALTNLCCDCCRAPCMISSLANILGDKRYLPFIPGTGAAIRFKVRILAGIHGTIANDCLVTSCCCPCATCQMYREMEDIGLGPGW